MTLKETVRLLSELSEFHYLLHLDCEEKHSLAADVASKSHLRLSQECESAAILVGTVNLTDPEDREKFQGE